MGVLYVCVFVICMLHARTHLNVYMDLLLFVAISFLIVCSVDVFSRVCCVVCVCWFDCLFDPFFVCLCVCLFAGLFVCKCGLFLVLC